ncbi:hypothetical protein EMIHUDRAFT_98951 [Emiliania huxleyi CCMP1516]|uniref:C2H2-type domain-containing protein n=2 Tax=Emiliania huxleyi TaxID=2903 RepID=A0A0D3KBX3_EMIH1|nr:hypothetical protein EMIHUDRAFT_98951 [Emiliania huxleyi CCMP1516]EOD33258.1 hypothetical protein EMIHUDRAFT_98951 [Emiliania huxleyi CCMP1516]|eukprot:XP_005785687.1 hypothetical protein EMIHUDRAFT_98951 [Emiliania huxleyi CCMP1516]
MLLARLPSGRTRLFEASGDAACLARRVEDAEGLPAAGLRLVGAGRRLRPTDPLAALAGATVQVHLSLAGGGGDGDQPDWIERGKMPSGGSKRRGPDSRAPDWHGDARKKEAKDRQDKLDRGELLVAIGPYCVPCGKRFAKQSVYDAHLSGKKHLAALEKLGRAEEAMVCRLDVEAKRRKNAEAQARAEAREEKLRERAMLPTPATVGRSLSFGGECVNGASSHLHGLPTGGGGVCVEAHRQMAITPSDWHKVPDHLKGRYDPERGDWRCDRCASWSPPALEGVGAD